MTIIIIIILWTHKGKSLLCRREEPSQERRLLAVYRITLCAINLPSPASAQYSVSFSRNLFPCHHTASSGSTVRPEPLLGSLVCRLGWDCFFGGAAMAVPKFDTALIRNAQRVSCCSSPCDDDRELNNAVHWLALH